MKEKIVTVDELWVEYKKSIDAGWGHTLSFKTKKGMVGHIKKLANKFHGIALVFTFKTGKAFPDNYLQCKIMIKKEWIKNDRNKKR